MGEEALTEREERLLDAVAQVLAGARSLLATGVAPGFERAFRAAGWPARPKRVSWASSQSAAKSAVALLGEDPRQVRLDPRRPREARVVAQDAEREPVAGEAPERAFGGVQVLLRQAEGAAPPAAVAEGGRRACRARGPRARSPPAPARPRRQGRGGSCARRARGSTWRRASRSRSCRAAARVTKRSREASATRRAALARPAAKSLQWACAMRQ